MFLPKIDTAGKQIGTVLIREPWDFIWIDLNEARVLAGFLTEETDHCAPLDQMIHVLNAQGHSIEVVLDSVENSLYQHSPAWWDKLDDQEKTGFMLALRGSCMRGWKVREAYDTHSSRQYIIGVPQQFMMELFLSDEFCASMLVLKQIAWYDIFEEDHEESDEAAPREEAASDEG